MIDAATLKEDWIKAHKKGHLSEENIEKACRCLYLVELMTAKGFDFTFKGGSCMMLFFDPPKRFSVDIDMFISEKESQRLIAWLQRGDPSKDRYYHPTPDRRGNEQTLHMAHYRLFYHSAITKKEETLVLDLLFDKPPYSQIEKHEIQCSFLKYNEEKAPQIKYPNPSELLGDKLTAFAPTTCGILYGKKRPLDIIKQLYDVAALASREDIDYSAVCNTYQEMAAEEIKRRENCKGLSPLDCLRDTMDACLCILCGQDFRDQQNSVLKNAVLELANYIQDYNPVTLIKTASIALKSALIVYLDGEKEYQDSLTAAEPPVSPLDFLPIAPKRLKELQADLRDQYVEFSQNVNLYHYFFGEEDDVQD